MRKPQRGALLPRPVRPLVHNLPFIVHTRTTSEALPAQSAERGRTTQDHSPSGWRSMRTPVIQMLTREATPKTSSTAPTLPSKPTGATNEAM